MTAQRAVQRIASVGIFMLLLSCGGGGGGGSSQTTQTQPPPPQGSPTAVIQAPQATTSYMTVGLDGTASSDGSSTLSKYQWTQTSGPTVALQNATSSQASFVAPDVTAPSTIGIELTVTDQLSTSASQTVNVTVNPPSTAQLTPAFISIRQLLPVNGNTHLDAVPVAQSITAGVSITIQVTLAGALQSPTFTLEDANGNSLGTLSLSQVGDTSQEPLNFTGTMTVPSVPFQLVVSGTSVDGRAYSLPNPTPSGALNNLMTPQSLGVSFNVQHVRLNSAAPSYTVQATVTNVGSSAVSLLPVIEDPAGVDPSQAAQGAMPVMTVAAGATTTIPLTLTFPTNPPEAVSTFTFAVVNAGNPTQVAGAALTLLLAN